MSDDRQGPPASVLGARLAASHDDPLPTWSDLGLDSARSAAFGWQRQRQYGRINEMAVLLQHPDGSRWVQELHGIIGSVGELVLVAIEAEVEKAIVAGRLAEMEFEEPNPSLRASLNRSLRFFAEGQANQIVVAGHGIANIGLRTLALHPSFDVTKVSGRLQVDPAKFMPKAVHRKAWTSLSAPGVEAMEQYARKLGGGELEQFIARLGVLAKDPAIAALINLRNEQYHRC